MDSPVEQAPPQRIRREYRRLANDYHALTLHELVAAASRASFDIRRNGYRTPRQRRELADVAACLLHEFAARMEGSPHVPGTPEQLAHRQHSIVESFGGWYERNKQIDRQRVIHRAADWVLGNRARDWLGSRSDACPPGLARYDVAIRDDDGLRAMLAELDGFERAPD